MLSERRRVYELVLGFFGGDEAKARDWMRLPNPLLGGFAPKDLIAIRPGKVIRFVEHSLVENLR